MESLVALLLLFSLVSSAKLPADFPSCKGRENLNGCLKSAIEDALHKLEDGIPDLSIPALQPLNTPSITIGQGKDTITSVQNFKNFCMYNLKDLKVQKIESSVSPSELKINIDGFLPSLIFLTDYDFNGTIENISLVGSGSENATYVDLKLSLKLVAEEFDKGGKSYFRVENIAVDLDPRYIEVDFKDAVDKKRGAKMNRLLNDNWKNVFKDVKDSYCKAVGTIFKDYANTIFTQIPSEDLF